MNQQCLYCTGNGYFQLITGGTDTCPSCLGTGNDGENPIQSEDSSYQAVK